MNLMNRLKIIPAFLSFVFLIIIFSSCKKEITPEEQKYIEQIEQDRKTKNEWMKNDPNSPFNFKGKVEFHPLNYFEVDPAFRFESKLYEYENKDTVVVYGTKGEERYPVRFGYIKFNYENKEYKVNVYRSTGSNGETYYSIWFTDVTTNEDSYGVGRYLNFIKSDDPEHIYTIDI